MNERMLGLYKQAHVSSTAIDPSNNMPYETTCFSADKFAELIVRECSNVITDLPNRMVDQELSAYNEGWRNGRLLAKEHIESHFGIE